MATPVTVPNLRTIVHQDKVEAVIDARVAGGGVAATQTSATIASPTADSAALKVAVDEIIAALVAAGVINVAV
jgi:hypothetical protein